MKIPPVETELFQLDRPTDGQTGRHEGASSSFDNFV